MDKNIFFHIAVMLIILGGFPAIAYSWEEQQPLREQIIIYNLINGLYLEEPQLRAIWEKAKELESLRNNMGTESKADSSDYSQALTVLKQEVKKEIPQISPEISRKIHGKNIAMEKMHEEYVEKLTQSVEQVKELLTDNQLYIIGTFKPCLIPPKGPARFGQVSSLDGLSKIFKRIKYVSDEEYERQRMKISDKYIEKISLQHPDYSQQQLEETRLVIFNILDELRMLSEVDFSLKQEAIMEKIENIAGPKKIDVGKRIGKFLLGPQAVIVLEEKLFPVPDNL